MLFAEPSPPPSSALHTPHRPAPALLVHARTTLLALDFFDPAAALTSGRGTWRGEVFLELLFQHAPLGAAALQALLPVRLLNFEGTQRAWLVDHGAAVVPQDAACSPSFRPTRASHAFSLCLHAAGAFSQAFDLGAFPLDAHMLRAEVALDVPVAEARFASEAENVWAPGARHVLAMPPSRAAALAHFDVLAAPQCAIFRSRPELSPARAPHSVLCLAYPALRRASARALAQALLPCFALGCAGLLARALSAPSGPHGSSSSSAGAAAQNTLLVLLFAVLLWGSRAPCALPQATLSEAYSALTLACLAAHFFCAAAASCGLLGGFLDSASTVLLAEVWVVINVMALRVYAKFHAAREEQGPCYRCEGRAEGAALEQEGSSSAVGEGGDAGLGGSTKGLGEEGGEEAADADSPTSSPTAATAAARAAAAELASTAQVSAARSALLAFQRGDFSGFLERERGEARLAASPSPPTGSHAAAHAPGGFATPSRPPHPCAAGSAPPTPAASEDVDNDPRIALAAQTNDVEGLALLLSSGGSVDSTASDSKCATALMRASRAGHVEAVQALLAAGASVNKRRGACGSTALLLAVKGGQLSVVRALLAGGADACAGRSDGGCTPLMWASWKGWGEGCAALLQGGAGAAINCGRGRDGATALMMAAREGHAECVQQLLAAGADREAVSSLGWRARDMARDPEVRRLLLPQREGGQ